MKRALVLGLAIVTALTSVPSPLLGQSMGGAENGSIVVMHFDSPTSVRSTAVALPGLIDDLRAAGYRLVTITELLTETESRIAASAPQEQPAT